MSQVTVVKRIFKYLLYFFLLLLFVSLLLLAYILHTESGSRFIIKHGIAFAELDLSYASINGNLSDGLTINNFKYSDQAIELKVNKLSYKSNWMWLSRHLELSEVNLDQVTIVTKNSAESTATDEGFSGFELPLSIDVKNFVVNQLLVSEELSADSIPTIIDGIELSAVFLAKGAEIKRFDLKAKGYGASGSGTIKYATGLNYALQLEWQAALDGKSIKASGPIKGDLASIKLHQELDVKSDVIQGQFVIDGQIFKPLNTPEFDFQLSAEESQLMLEQQPLEIKQLQAEFKGEIDAYNISVQSQLNQLQLNDLNFPSSQIKIQASGNSLGSTIEFAQILSPEGSVDLQAKLSWKNQIEISSQLAIKTFNPQQLFQDWPGKINGSINLDLLTTEQGIELTTSNNSLYGELKGQPFKLVGSVDYAANTFSAEQLRIDLGDNFVQLNGQMNQQNVSLTAALNWSDLSLLDTQLAGHVEGTVELSGAFLNPEINAALEAHQLSYGEYQISTLVANSQGKWNEDLTTKLELENISLDGQVFDSIQVLQNGWLNNHNAEINLKNSELSSVLKFKGVFDSKATGKQPLWHGQVISHELLVDTDKTIKLQAPIEIKIADQISIGAGCWQGVEAGTLCFELNDIKQTDTNYQGKLSLNAFSLIPLQVFLPPNIELKGTVQGNANFLYHSDDLNVEASLALEGGELLIGNEQEIIYKSAIDTFEINAKTTNQDIDVIVNTQLADKSYLNLQAKIDNSNNEWQINSKVEGVFLNSEFIQNMTEEIKELKGEITIDGSVMGPLSKPIINFNLSQPDGYLSLTRLGTVIENLALSIVTEGVKQPIYKINFSGDNLAAINQGQIKSSGVLSFAGKNQWQYEGDITGDNFMLLNLPEAKFNISPKLSIMANEKFADISGGLSIDSGHVIVKQLPLVSVSNSGDLEIHTSGSNNSSKYPVSMNVLAKIKDPIELDVIGLVAGLTGSIQLVQAEGKSIAGKGVLNLTDGSYEIYGQKLSIDEGEMTFTGPLDNPRLKVKASRVSLSGDVVAGVELGGTVNNLQSTLFSEPSLSDIEKLSYIMSGSGIDNSGSMNAEQLKQAAIVMGLNQSSPIFSQIQSQFGIDVLTLHESAVAADTVVEAGKKVNDKLYISYNQGLFNRLGFWMIKYRINQFLNLETTQGDDQSIELVYIRKAEIKNKKDK